MDPSYVCFVLLGTGLLLPWNSFINAADYYAVRYEGVHVDRLITVCYLPFNLIVLALLIHYHGVISARLRVVAGFAVFTLAAAAMPLLDSFPAGSGSLALMLILVATCGIADGAAQGALFGEAAARDPRYIQALVAGTAIAGTAVSGLRILTKAALPATPEGLRTSENLYFLTTAILCAACGFVYSAVLPRLHKRQLWNSPSVEVVAVVSNMNDAEANGAAADQGNSFIHIESLGMERSPEYGAVSNIEEVADSLLRAPSKGDAYHHQPHSSNTSSPEPYFPLRISYLDVAWQVRWFALSVVLVYVVTLSIFPGVLAEDITSGRIGTWYPVLLIALFNVADLAGKWLPALPSCRFKGRDKIGIAALARIAFVPAFHFAATRGAGPAVVSLLTLLLGVSNGFVSTLCLVAAPASVEPRAAALCGNIMVLSLITGLCIGAACGFLWLL